MEAPEQYVKYVQSQQWKDQNNFSEVNVNFEQISHIVLVFPLTLNNWMVAGKLQFCHLTLSCIMLINGQTYFKNLAIFTPQDF